MKSSLDKAPEYITSARHAWIARLGLAIGIGLVVLVLSLLYSAPARADGGARPVIQETGGYPVPEVTQDEDSGYPGPGETTVPLPTFLDPEVTASPETLETSAVTATPQPTITPRATNTLSPDVLATEKAEMGNAQVTPPGSETPGPSMTPYQTGTGTQTVLPSNVSSANKKGGLSVDWGLFWIGFSIPVLLACGGVLYLLDRRPNFFRPR